MVAEQTTCHGAPTSLNGLTIGTRKKHNINKKEGMISKFLMVSQNLSNIY